MARKYQRQVKRHPKPHGFIMPKPSQLRPSTPLNDKRQLSLFDLPKQPIASYVETPLTPELATQLLARYGALLEQEERQVLFTIERGVGLNPQQREILNVIFAKLEPRS